MKEIERNLKALANGRRLAILKYVQKHKRATVTDISTHIKLSFRSTSRHLAILRSAGVFDREHVGVEMYYFLAKGHHRIVQHVLMLL